MSLIFSIDGVFESSLERAVAAAMFWAGLRRSEIFGLLPSALDWSTPCIRVDTAWKNFGRADKVLGDPKHHKHRIAPFPDILQAEIRKLWAENGQHEFVFSRAGRRNHPRRDLVRAACQEVVFSGWDRASGQEDHATFCAPQPCI